MTLVPEIRRRAPLIISPLIGLALVAYFTYHIISGERGLIAWLQLEQKVVQAEKTAQNTARLRAVLEHRVGLLRSDQLDPDMLEELAREILNLGRENEILLISVSG